MSVKSSIEWTDGTLNLLTGCNPVSPGCRNCYAKTLALRLQAMGNPSYENGFQLTYHPHMLDKLQEWKEPKRIFFNSMSDIFHEGLPDDIILSSFNEMMKTSHLLFQVLTKRHERLLEMSPKIKWTRNICMGVSVENQDYVHRIDCLRQTNAHIKFLSLEPLLGPLPNLNLEGIDWVIVGGESGRGKTIRPLNPEWVRDIRDQCLKAKVHFFFKQWGKLKNNPDPNDPTAKENKKGGGVKGGCQLDGKIWNEMPVILQGREWVKVPK